MEYNEARRERYRDDEEYRRKVLERSNLYQSLNKERLKETNKQYCATKVLCSICPWGKEIARGGLNKHIRSVHKDDHPAPCPEDL